MCNCQDRLGSLDLEVCWDEVGVAQIREMRLWLEREACRVILPLWMSVLELTLNGSGLKFVCDDERMENEGKKRGRKEQYKCSLLCSNNPQVEPPQERLPILIRKPGTVQATFPKCSFQFSLEFKERSKWTIERFRNDMCCLCATMVI